MCRTVINCMLVVRIGPADWKQFGAQTLSSFYVGIGLSTLINAHQMHLDKSELKTKI